MDGRDSFTVKVQAHLAKAIDPLPSLSQEAMRPRWLAVRILEAQIRSLEIAMEA